MEAQAGSVFSGNVKFPVQHIWEREKEKTRIQLRGATASTPRQTEKKRPSGAALNLARYYYYYFFLKIQPNDRL